MHQLGDVGPTVTPELLALATAMEAVRKEQELRAQVLAASFNAEESRKAAIKEEINLLARQTAAQNGLNPVIAQFINFADYAAIRQIYEAQAIENVNSELRQQEYAAHAAARAQEDLANASAFAAVQQRNLAQVIGAASDMATQAIQDQIDALDEAAAARSRADQLSLLNIQEQLAMGADLDPNQLSGEAKILAIEERIARLRAAGGAVDRSGVEAIDERIKALRREGDERERISALLDLQYRKSQIIRRQTGESIQDFLQRRAQEQRHQLEEEEKLERDAQIAKLEAEKEKLEAQLNRIDKGNDAAIRALEKEKELERIRLARAKLNEEALTAQRKKALEEQLEKTRQFWRNVEQYADTARINELASAIQFSKTMQELLTISAEVTGAKLAAAQLRAMLASGLVPPALRGSVLAILAEMDRLARTYNTRIGQLTGLRVAPGYGDLRGGITEGFASGGVLNLTNASSPFGQNIRFGEGGTEMGVILSNRVTKAIQDSMGGGPAVGQINIQRTDDPRHAEYRLRRLVREEVDKALSR
jgi:hypothetical protein